ncbi:MAG: MotA/TolQ/ExbB proton channel family protein [Polyangiales bacterium]
MYLILACLVMAIGFTVERMMYLRKASISKNEFIETMQKCITAGDVAQAIKVCSAEDAPLSRIVKSGLLKVNRPDDEVQAAMDEAALRELPLIERRTPYLGLLANVGMLCGLFGTVVGLIKAFGEVASADAASKATGLAHGIEEAMNCTAFGLITAVFALVMMGLLNGKTQKLIDDINLATVQVLNLVVGNRSRVDLQNLG